MADLKISQLTSNPEIDGTEEIPTAKAGSNFKNTLTALKTWTVSPINITVASAQALVAGSTVVPGAWYNITDSSQAINAADRILVQGTAVNKFDQIAVYVDNINNERDEIQYILDNTPTDLIVFRKDNLGNEIWDTYGSGCISQFKWRNSSWTGNKGLTGFIPIDIDIAVLAQNIIGEEVEITKLNAGSGGNVSGNIINQQAVITLNSDIASCIFNTIGIGASITCSKVIRSCIIGQGCVIDDGRFSLIGCTFPSGMTFTATQNYTNVNFGNCKNIKFIDGADSPYSTPPEEYTVLCKCTGNIVVDVTASEITGNIINIKKMDATVNTVTITPTSTIDGAATYVLYAQHESIQMQFDGSDWQII